MRRHSTLHIILAASLSCLLAACASIGRPQGGPRDEVPPVFTRSTPQVGARNFSGKRLDLYFDENIKLDDAFNKVIVSPAQTQAPVVSANGRHLTVELRDTLLPETTYTIDFADAIQDLNEGNILDGFAIDFSTGPELDSLRISGIVLQARDLEPAQGILVGAYTADVDSLITTTPLERVTRTNQLGQFTLRNLKAGEYFLYAINDVSRDYHWDRSEDVAFLGTAVVPSVRDIMVTDTLRSAEDTDSLVLRAGVQYLPNDLLLTTFNEGFLAQYIKDRSRPERRRILINMAAPAQELMELTLANGPLAGAPASEWGVLRRNATLDSLELWITAPEALAADTLQLAMRYQRTSADQQLEWTTDTAAFIFKEPKKKKDDKAQASDTAAAQLTFITLSFPNGGRQDLHRPLIMNAQQPLAAIDSAGVRLLVLHDTIWTTVPGAVFLPDSLAPLMRRVMPIKWEPGTKYKIEIDSAAVTNIYGEHNRPQTFDFTTRNLDDYVSLAFVITGPDAPAIVELLNRDDRPVAIAPAVGGKATFTFMPPGDYYARLYLDTDSSGTWTTGNMALRQQPEEVYYYPKKISLKQNWDVELAWDIYQTAIDAQKPYAIKKNKPKLKKGETAPVDPDEVDNEAGLYGPATSGRGNNTSTRNTGRGSSSRNTTGGRRLNGNLR